MPETSPVIAALMTGDDLLALELLERPAWHRHAACRGQGTAAWFPETGESGREAKRVCASCSVRVQCELDGLRGHEHGIGGGSSARERAEARRLGVVA